MAAANETLERVMVVVNVAFLTCTKAIGIVLPPPPEHDENPRDLIKDCSPVASRVTWPLAEGRASVYTVGRVKADPDVVTQAPFDMCADVIENALMTL